MIRALLTATGAVWWACAIGILAVVGIGRLGASWRERRASSHAPTAPLRPYLPEPPRCRWCDGPVEHPGCSVIGVDGQMHHVTMCNGCIGDWLTLRFGWPIPREVQG